MKGEENTQSITSRNQERIQELHSKIKERSLQRMIGEAASKDIDRVFKKHNALGNKTQSMSKPVFTSRNLSSNASPSPNRFQKNALTTNTGSNAEIKGVTSSKIDKLRFAKFRNGSSYIKTG